ncbi:hypothetical protein DdX_17838 [Ditylenchus destructor]|uniref:Uncharacterized protein n=1 Tax=Ditylenchus destructor TaxID=166010 RepID=A0AAD4MMA6_9BILA|nr:hypothetical protein DdX_17838 [Ditylenchus destructor]
MSQIIRDANLTFRKDGTKGLRGGGMIGGRLVSGKGHVTADGGVKLILHQTNDNLTDENTITLTMSNREEIEAIRPHAYLKVREDGAGLINGGGELEGKGVSGGGRVKADGAIEITMHPTGETTQG